MELVRIAAAPGRLVRHPDTRRELPAEGLLVVLAGFWLRRLADGDIVVLEAFPV